MSETDNAPLVVPDSEATEVNTRGTPDAIVPDFNTGSINTAQSPKAAQQNISNAQLQIIDEHQHFTLFGTSFEEMTTEARRQTTKGIWCDQSVYKNNVIVLDVEGTDGGEHGEDQEFERKSALFSLAITEVLVVNIWENSVGLYNSANMGLLKTVFEVNLELFGRDKVKTLLFFSIRDHTSQVTLDALKDTLMKNLEKVWAKIAKPADLQDVLITDYFDFAFSSLPNKPLQPVEFEEASAKLRERFMNPDHPDYVFRAKYMRRIPIDGIPHYAESIWEKIVTNKDLDLPTQQELLAQYRCDEISRQVVDEFHKSLAPIRVSVDSKSLSESIGTDMKVIRERTMSAFEAQASRYQRSVYDKSHRQLFDLLNNDLHVLFVRLVKKASNKAIHVFTSDVKERLERAVSSGEDYEFTDIVQETREGLVDEFKRLASSSCLEDTDWSYEDEAIHLDQMMDNVVGELRKNEVSRIVDKTRKAIRNKVTESLVTELNEPSDKMWKNIISEYLGIVSSASKGFLARILPIVGSESKMKVLKQLRQISWEDFVAKAQEEVSDQMILLKLRNHLEEQFRYDAQGLPRVWLPSDDIDTQFDQARTSTQKLIPIYCNIDVQSWNEESTDGPWSEYFPSDYAADETTCLISPSKAREVQKRFQREADALYLEAKRSTVSTQSRIPYWMLLLTVMLGWNEAMTILFNPIYLVLFLLVVTATFIIHQLGLWGPVIRFGGTFGNIVTEKIHLILLEAVHRTEPQAIQHGAVQNATKEQSWNSTSRSNSSQNISGISEHQQSSNAKRRTPKSSAFASDEGEDIEMDSLSHNG
ncbi:Dynamin-like GTPase that mediates homotypic ER fusion [Mycoemilia scoparia]|uniref:Dynamin-like GTPase that mediates homotypic ER fusion n=1 Tax=Mycoemilia scoparia TaxID=417184 RepID=A0A9W8A1G2_9FUNG|nr:Dynamin-like GTPase that mediates homotypic ER fusion [Mycoemilia scoparia]